MNVSIDLLETKLRPSKYKVEKLKRCPITKSTWSMFDIKSIFLLNILFKMLWRKTRTWTLHSFCLLLWSGYLVGANLQEYW